MTCGTFKERNDLIYAEFDLHVGLLQNCKRKEKITAPKRSGAVVYKKGGLDCTQTI